MADATHSLSRLWLRQHQDDGQNHISPGCSHDWSASFCGVPSSALGPEEGDSPICPTCLHAWHDAEKFNGSSLMLPRGDIFVLLDAEGTLRRAPHFSETERRAHRITRNLKPLSPESFGSLGVMDLSLGSDGLVHGDPWCVEYDGSTSRPLPVSMTDGSVKPHFEGSPLHCQRRLPEHVENAFFAAISVCRARNGVLSVMGYPGWGLCEAIRHERGMHGMSETLVCDSGAFEVENSLTASRDGLSGNWGAPAPLLRESERTREVWGAVKRVMQGWETSQEAVVELGRATLMLSLASGEHSSPDDVRSSGVRRAFSTPAIQALTQYGISAGHQVSVINVCRVRVALGRNDWISPMPANRAVVRDEIISQLSEIIPSDREAEVGEDLADFMMSQDHAFYVIAEQYMREAQPGILLEVNSELVPAHWMLWPHGVDAQRSALHWVPLPVAKATPMETFEATPAPFLPMTFEEARTLLIQRAGSGAR